MKDMKGWDPEFFMSFMLFMVKAVSGMKLRATTRFAPPNRQDGAPSAPPAPSAVKIPFVLVVAFVVLPARSSRRLWAR